MIIKGYLIYNKIDFNKNKWFANELVREAKKLDIELDIIFSENIMPRICGNEFGFIYEGEHLAKVDIVINRSRNSMIGKHFELMKTRVYNSSLITDICNNKAKTHQYINSLGIESVKTLVLRKDNNLLSNIDMEYPLVAKSLSGHGGQEVCKIENKEELIGHIITQHYNEVLVQEMCKKVGVDIRVFIIGGEVLASIKRSSKESFKSNFSLGGTATPYDLEEKELWIVEKILKEFKLDFAGIDFILGENDKFLFNEIEDVVGCRTLYQNYNINVACEYMKYIKKSLIN